MVCSTFSVFFFFFFFPFFLSLSLPPLRLLRARSLLLLPPLLLLLLLRCGLVVSHTSLPADRFSLLERKTNVEWMAGVHTRYI